MSVKYRLGALTGFVCLALFNVCASADDHAYTEGPVVSVSSIRTADGKFDDYMKFVDTNWKQQQEAAKKAGDVVSYQVLNVVPRGPDDPDLLLVVTYKSWAAGFAEPEIADVARTVGEYLTARAGGRSYSQLTFASCTGAALSPLLRNS